MIYKKGTKLTDRGNGQIFIVAESTPETTRYVGHGVSGECPTSMLNDTFLIEGKPLLTVDQALSAEKVINPDRLLRIVQTVTGVATTAACLKFLFGG